MNKAAILKILAHKSTYMLHFSELITYSKIVESYGRWMCI